MSVVTLMSDTYEGCDLFEAGDANQNPDILMPCRTHQGLDERNDGFGLAHAWIERGEVGKVSVLQMRIWCATMTQRLLSPDRRRRACLFWPHGERGGTVSGA
jgi:hypothetical protein